MDLPNPSLPTLFEQLGLSSDEPAMQAFIAEHQLDNDTKLVDAPFWSEQQRNFLKEELLSDAEWAPIVDELNVALHPQNHT
jgi:Protein of unknown function (DUF2789)